MIAKYFVFLHFKSHYVLELLLQELQQPQQLPLPLVQQQQQQQHQQQQQQQTESRRVYRGVIW